MAGKNNPMEQAMGVVTLMQRLGIQPNDRQAKQFAASLIGMAQTNPGTYDTFHYMGSTYGKDLARFDDAKLSNAVAQYGYRKKRADEGYDPVDIADISWNPLQHDDDTNETLGRWYKQNNALPGADQQEQFQAQLRQYKLEKAIQTRQDTYALAGLSSPGSGELNFNGDWKKMGFEYDGNDAGDRRRKQLGMPPKSFLSLYQDDDDDKQRLRTGQLPKSIGPGRAGEQETQLQTSPIEKLQAELDANAKRYADPSKPSIAGNGGGLYWDSATGAGYRDYTQMPGASGDKAAKPDYGKGNVDLNTWKLNSGDDVRLVPVETPSADGKMSTKYIAIPMTLNGRKLSEEEATKQYTTTGRTLGEFASVDEANQYLNDLYGKQIADERAKTVTTTDYGFGFKGNFDKNTGKYLGMDLFPTDKARPGSANGWEDLPPDHQEQGKADYEKYAKAGEEAAMANPTFQQWGRSGGIRNWRFLSSAVKNPAQFAWDNADAIMKPLTQGHSNATNRPDGFDLYLFMTPEELKNYNYLIGKTPGSKSAAEDWFHQMVPALEERRAKAQDQSLHDFAKEHPGYGAATAIVAQLGAPLGAIKTLQTNYSNLMTGRNDTVDINSPWFNGIRASEVAQSATLEDASPTMRFIGQTGYSVANNLMNYGLYGAGAPFMMALQQAGQASYDTTKRGGTAFQALSEGIQQGVEEYIGEKVNLKGLEKIVNGKASTVRGVVKQIGAQMGIEFTEEAATQTMNIITDLTTMGSRSEMGHYFAQYAKDHAGAPQWQAYAMTALEALKQIGHAGVQGGISALFMGGGAAAHNGVVNSELSKKTVDINAQKVNSGYALGAGEGPAPTTGAAPTSQSTSPIPTAPNFAPNLTEENLASLKAKGLMPGNVTLADVQSGQLPQGPNLPSHSRAAQVLDTTGMTQQRLDYPISQDILPQGTTLENIAKGTLPQGETLTSHSRAAQVQGAPGTTQQRTDDPKAQQPIAPNVTLADIQRGRLPGAIPNALQTSGRLPQALARAATRAVVQVVPPSPAGNRNIGKGLPRVAAVASNNANRLPPTTPAASPVNNIRTSPMPAHIPQRMNAVQAKAQRNGLPQRVLPTQLQRNLVQSTSSPLPAGMEAPLPHNIAAAGVPAYNQQEAQPATQREAAQRPAAGAGTKGPFSREALQNLRSFQQDLPAILERYGMSMERFQELRSLPAEKVEPKDQVTLRAIRDLVPKPTVGTVMQKVIPFRDIAKYLDEADPWKGVMGYVARAADVKQLGSYKELYDALRLDYLNDKGLPNYHLSDGSCGVIRFKTQQIDEANIPYSSTMAPEKEKVYKANDPFTGNGFTAARNGHVVPEYVLDDLVDLENNAELYEVFHDGTEKLLAIYDFGKKRFVKVN